MASKQAGEDALSLQEWLGLSNFILGGDGWTPLSTCSEGGVWSATSSRATTLIKIASYIETDPDVLINPIDIPRPEAQATSTADLRIIHVERMLQTNEPGDVVMICSLGGVWGMCGGGDLGPFAAVVELLFGPRFIESHAAALNGQHVARVAIRRCAPYPDCVCVLHQVLSRDTLRPYAAYFGILRIAPASGKLLFIQTVEALSKAAKWAPTILARLPSGLAGTMRRLFESRCLHDSIDADKYYYVTLSLKRCARGPPLLPVSEPTENSVTIEWGAELGLPYWVAQPNNQQLDAADYVAHLCAFMNLDIQFYKTWDGLNIVRYQAVAQRREWESIQQTFAPAFRTQGSAYRKMFGGSSCPQLVVARGEPKMLTSATRLRRVQSYSRPTSTSSSPYPVVDDALGHHGFRVW